MSNLVAFKEMREMADCISQSGLFGLKTAEQVLALMVLAQAEGRHPGIVARDYHIIQNRPALKADAMLARFQESGGSVEWHAYTHECVDATFKHPNGGKIKLAWTLDDAKRAGLDVTKDNWKKYPRAMLRARVISEAIRTCFPSVICGTYTPEEIEDFSSNKNKEIDITPKEENKKILVTEDTLFKLAEVIDRLDVSKDTIKKWHESESVASIDLISEEFANKIINSAKQKIALLSAKDAETTTQEIKNAS